MAGLDEKRRKAEEKKWGARTDALRKAEERKQKMMNAGPTRERSESKRVPPPPKAENPRAAADRQFGAAEVARFAAQTQANADPRRVAAARAAATGIPSLSGVDAAVAPDPLEAIIASLPPIDIASYTGPYDEAMATARQTQEEAVPYIGTVYDELRGKLGATQKDFAEQSMGINVQLQDVLKERMAALQGVQGGVSSDVNAQAGGEMNATLQAMLGGELGAQRGQLQTNATQQQSLVDRLAEVRAQGNADRVADTHTAQGAAVANSKNNLQSVLDKLGVAKAGAERDYAEDTASRNAQVQKLRLDFLDRQAEAAEEAAAAQRKAAEEEKKFTKERETQEKEYFKQNARSPRQRFEEQWEAREQNNPKAMSAFKSIVDQVKGKGPRAVAEAVGMLNTQRAAFSSGQNPTGAKLNPDVIEEWLRAYYDEEPRL